MTTGNRRLPRGPKPAPIGPEERVRKATGADLQNGWWGRHGTLRLTDTRFVFTPTLLDRILGGRSHEIPLDELQGLERWPIGPGTIPPGGKRPRLLFHTDPCTYEFMVGDVDSWFDVIEAVYLRRAERVPNAHIPYFQRSDVENILLADD